MSRNPADHATSSRPRTDVEFSSPWRKYKLLWQYNKGNTCILFADKNPSIVAYDEKLLYFSNIIQKLERSADHVDIGCVRLNLQPLLLEIRRHALSWKLHLAHDVLAASKLERRTFLMKTFMLKFEMEKPVKEDDIISLKNVLDAIVRIRQTSAEAEVQAQQIEESYRTLTLYDIEVDEGDLKLSQELLPYWEFVRLSSLVRMEELQPLKERYAIKTETFVKAFATRCEDFVARFFSNGPGSELVNLTQGLMLMKSFTEELETLNIERQRLVEDELLFDVPLADFSALHNVQNTMKHLDSVFHIYEAQKAARDVWASTLWIDLAPSTLTDGMRHFIDMFDDLPLEAQTMPVAVQLRQNMKDFQNSVPMFEALKNDALRERHWQQLMQKTGKHFDVSPENFTLQSLFAMELHQHKEESASIVLHATRELVIEQLLADIKRSWGGKEFALLPHVRRGENFGFVLGPVNEICQLQLDHTNSLKQVFTSPYVGPFIESVTEWEKNLSHVQETVALWTRVQDEWLDLEHVIENEEIFSQLSTTVIAKFEYCDKNFRMIMSETSKNSLVVAACCRSGCLEELKNINNALEECQRCLGIFLSAKRQIFPRLNFVTDQELLSLIGGKLPQCVQQQITKLKLFPHISSLEFEDGENGQMNVTALVSQEGERVELRYPVDTAHCEVENWLAMLVPRLQAALRHKIKFAIYDYGHTKLSQEQWSVQFAGMVSLAALHVWWTVKVEDVFDQLKSGDIRSMKIYLDELNQQIDYLSKYLISVKDNMEKVKLTSILIQNLHFRDIVSHLVFNAVIVKTDFNWESQLRFYWEKREDSLIVKQCCCRLEFGYEYTGLNYRLVHTPQTDRVMLIITQALSMQLGVMLIGGPGLGKTETVREMARILGRICLVTDCNAQMTWKSIGNILAGLAQSGLWGCLEQLDRLSESTLSVLSTQIHTIRDAVLMKLTSFSFNDQEIGLDSKLAIFTSISPNQKGRQEVPQTLRALFRPASCSMPDLQHICHVWLLATGFDTAQVLSKKITELCKYSAEQLSKQPHYNFTMCLVKTIIKYSAKYRTQFPESSENNVVLKALRDCILPKLVPEDIELFLALLKDMFPRVEIPEVSRSALRKAIEECIISNGYTSIPGQVETIIQLDELLSVNSTAILIGASGSGKSVITQLLSKAKSQFGLTTEIAVLSPKSCPIVELFGTVDPETDVWKDGLFTYIYKTINKQEKYQQIKTFILFDGTVDPIWIENICSVLDENRLLTLANGDKIPLKKQCNILFEVGTLQFFSPALLSRVCPIFLNTNGNMHEYVWNRWLKTHPDIAVELQKLYQMFVPSMIKNIESHKMKTILHFSTLNMITQLCYMIDILLTDCVNSEKYLTCYFIQALYLSLGATILVQHRESFDTHVKDILGWKLIDDSPEHAAIYQEIPSGSLFEYFWDTNRQAWINWSWNVAAYVHEPEKPLSEILVPTSYTGQTTWLLNLTTKFYFHELFFQKVFRPLVLVGTTGSSKTITIQSFLRNLDLTIYLPQSVALSSSTSAMQIQTVIEATMQNRTRDVLEPIAGKKVVIFLDDLNMPMFKQFKVDEFGSREPIEFLRLLYEQGGMYGRGKEMQWKQLKDIGFVGAISILSGPAAPLDPRFLSKLCLVHLPRPPEHLLHRIFSQILRGHLQDFAGEVLELTDSIVSASLHLFQLLYEALPPTPARWTCHLSTRDLTRLFGGVCLSNPSHFCTSESIVRLWRHEVCRVFTDRFESQEFLASFHFTLGMLGKRGQVQSWAWA
ncbi:hypothetical protein B566_EDAN005479 [Ephemera danica]|nr:hypothetical protein B566_EDAN005479 [Ephemera danica]